MNELCAEVLGVQKNGINDKRGHLRTRSLLVIWRAGRLDDYRLVISLEEPICHLIGSKVCR